MKSSPNYQHSPLRNEYIPGRDDGAAISPPTPKSLPKTPKRKTAASLQKVTTKKVAHKTAGKVMKPEVTKKIKQTTGRSRTRVQRMAEVALAIVDAAPGGELKHTKDTVKQQLQCTLDLTESFEKKVEQMIAQKFRDVNEEVAELREKTATFKKDIGKLQDEMLAYLEED